MTFHPRAAGTRRDIRERTDLAREIPFFGSRDEAAHFVRLGVAPLAATLPRDVRYVDFGGGQGVLAAVVRDALAALGHEVTATVVDGNPHYLADAARVGLATCLGNIQDGLVTGADLATMRLVNHYNSEPEQRAMLRAIRSALHGGPFVMQIETSSPLICALHTAISALLHDADEGAGDGAAAGAQAGYWWPTLTEWMGLLEDAGFCDARVVACTEIDTSVDQSLAAAWRRFHAFEAVEGARTDPQALSQFVERRTRFLTAARQLVADALAAAEETGEPEQQLARGFVRLNYPTVVCR